MKVIKLLILLIFSVSLNAQNVAYDSYNIFSKQRGENISNMIFYPSLEKEDFILGEHKLFQSEKLALKGKVKDGKYPLILLSHGGLRSAPNQINWLAKSLVKQGFVVLLVRNKLNKKLALYEPWLRATDMYLSFLNLKKSSFKNIIDFDKIYSVGFLLGGTSTLILNSAKINLNAYKSMCKNVQSIDCRWYKKNKIDLNSFDESFIKSFNYSIPIQKTVLFDVELSKLFDKESLEKISSKLYFINLSYMKLLDNSHFKAFSKYTKIEKANVFSSFSICTKKGEIVLKGTKEDKNLCFDSKEKKKIIHEKIINKIVKYF